MSVYVSSKAQTSAQTRTRIQLLIILNSIILSQSRGHGEVVGVLDRYYRERKLLFDSRFEEKNKLAVLNKI